MPKHKEKKEVAFNAYVNQFFMIIIKQKFF